MSLAQTTDTTLALDCAPTLEARSIIRWCVPDVAMTFAVLTLLSLGFMPGRTTTLFADSDTGWHIRNGERIISTGTLPHADPFSFSKPGEPWIAWEWGSDVLMGAVFQVSGLPGIALFFGLAISAAVWMWFRLTWAVGGNVLLAGLFLTPMLITSSVHWLARPHILSWLFLLGTVWFCEVAPHRLRWGHLALVAALTAVWANLHASFFFAPVIALIYAAGAFIRPRIWDVQRPVSESAWGTGCRNYLLLALAASLGSFANPNGWRLHRHVLSYLANSAMLDQITEFQSFDFHSEGALWVMLTVAICFAGCFAALAIQKPAQFLLSLIFAAAALRSVRVMPLAALLVVPLANASIAAVLTRAGGLLPSLRARLDKTLAYGRNLRVIDQRFRGYAIVPLAAVLVFLAIRHTAEFPYKILPVAASESVASLPADARILAPDTFGSYLIYRFKGERKVFFDGRSDFYGTAFLAGYSRLMGAQRGWRAEFNRWHFTNALLPPDSPLIPLLEANGWRELYHDEIAVLLTVGQVANLRGIANPALREPQGISGAADTVHGR